MQHGMLPVGHPLLYHAATTAKPAMVVFSVPVAARTNLAWLQDHRVGVKVLLPGALYLEMAVAAAAALGSSQSQLTKAATAGSSGWQAVAPALSGVVLAQPCVLPSSSSSSIKAEQQLVLSCEVQLTTGAITISSSSLGSSSAVHMAARLVSLDTIAVQRHGESICGGVCSVSAEALRASCVAPSNPSHLYQALHTAGLQYGPSFRRIHSVHSNNSSTATAQIAADAAGLGHDPSPISGFYIHPAVLDNVLQLGATIPETQGKQQQQASAMVPAAVRLYHPLIAAAAGDSSSWGMFTGVAKRSSSSSSKVAGATFRDHMLLDGSGAPLLLLDGLEARSLDGSGANAGAATAGRAGQKAVDEVLYEVQWVAEELPAAAASGAVVGDEASIAVSPAAGRGNLLLGAACEGIGSAVAAVQQMVQMQQVTALAATTTTASGSIVPSAAADSAAAVEDALLHASMKGMLRSVAQELPALGLSGELKDSYTSVAALQAATITIGATVTAAAADGYGTGQAAGVAYTPMLTPTTSVFAADAPHHLVPLTKGSLGNLVPELVVTELQQPDTVLLAVKAVGINFRDVLNVLGMYPGDPGAPGSDCAGVVIKANNKTGVQPGQSVFGLAEGCLGTTVVASSLTLVGLPSTISYEAAATMPTVFITADMTLQQAAAVQPGESVLVHAAAGGVGLAASQVLAGLGAVCVATGGSPSKRVLLRGLGVGAVVGSRDSSFVEPLAQLGGCDVLLNSLTSPGMVAASMALIKQGGRMAEIGKRDIWSAAAAAAERPDVSYSCVAVDFMTASGINAAMTRLSAKLAAGAVAPLPGAVHSLSQVAAALRQMSQARHVGKVVVRTRTSAFENQALSGAVLVIGGTGVLGALIIQWLAEKGVQKIPVLSRTGRISSSLSSLIGRGGSSWAAEVSILAADSSSSEDSGMVSEQLAELGMPLVGVMHAGGVLADATLSKQTVHGFRKVASPKLGALPLIQKLLLQQPVASSVLFSSVASLLGSPGQSNYAAANAGLDGAAGVLSAAGLGVVSCQWGAWAGAGMAAQDASTAARVARSGMELLQPQHGLAALEGLLGGLGASRSAAAAMSPVVAGVPFVWDAFMKRFPAGAAPPLLQNYTARKDTAAGGVASAGTSSGKVLTPDGVKGLVVETVTGVLGQVVSPDEPLMAAGLDSLGAVELRNALEGALGISLPGTLVFDYPSVDAMTQFILSQIPAADAAAEDAGGLMVSAGASLLTAAAVATAPADMQAMIGITGTASYSPRSAITSLQPVDAISAVPLSRWDWEALATTSVSKQGGVVPARFGGWLSGVEMFDAGLFGISGVEAELMDAQQRLLLQAAHQAITAAAAASGAAAAAAEGAYASSVMEVTAAAGVNTCVAVGIASAEYNNWVLRRQGVATSAYSATGGALSVASGRLAFLYGMRGAALSVDTACSSSLVAAHFVSNQLSGGVSKTGLAAGVGLLLSPEPTAMFQKAGMLAPDGRCKTLDAAADGYVRAEACGALVMQLVTDLDCGSSCSAVFSGSAVNQDGRSSSLTAPNGPAQQEVIRSALAAAGLQPHQVAALQLHGTGTALGDPIEMGAAAAVFFSKEQQAVRVQPIVATASKSWMGHTEAAAGSMGLIHAFTGKRGCVCQLHGYVATNEDQGPPVYDCYELLVTQFPITY